MDASALQLHLFSLYVKGDCCDAKVVLLTDEDQVVVHMHKVRQRPDGVCELGLIDLIDWFVFLGRSIASGIFPSTYVRCVDFGKSLWRICCRV